MNNTIKSILAVILAGSASAAFATSYSNTGDNSNIYPMGSPDTTSYGEVFSAPGGKLLDWSFYLNSGNSGNGNFVVAAWDGSKAVGPALYQQAFSYTAGPSVTQSFGGINLDLTSGANYIAYMTVAGAQNPYSTVNANGSDDNGGLGGFFTYLNSAGVDPLTLDGSWTTGYVVPDMLFSADFGDGSPSGVPEPGSLALLAIGCAGLARLRARKG